MPYAHSAIQRPLRKTCSRIHRCPLTPTFTQPHPQRTNPRVASATVYCEWIGGQVKVCPDGPDVPGDFTLQSMWVSGTLTYTMNEKHTMFPTSHPSADVNRQTFQPPSSPRLSSRDHIAASDREGRSFHTSLWSERHVPAPGDCFFGHARTLCVFYCTRWLPNPHLGGIATCQPQVGLECTSTYFLCSPTSHLPTLPSYTRLPR